jgi:hypothetical protein
MMLVLVLVLVGAVHRAMLAIAMMLMHGDRFVFNMGVAAPAARLLLELGFVLGFIMLGRLIR